MTGETILLAAAIVPLVWLVPLVRVGRAWWPTSLRHAWCWLAAAWLGWILLPAIVWFAAHPVPWFYLAMVLSACAFTATLGARLPGMAAWNFVVVGLLVTLAMPLLEQPWSAAVWRLDEPRSLFLAVILFVALLDYLPTRHSLATLLCAGAFGWLLYGLHFGFPPEHRQAIFIAIYLTVAVAAWLAVLAGRGSDALRDPDDLWLAFRDRYGAVWALRVLEQANQSFKHLEWNVRLTWFGVTPFTEGSALPPRAEVTAKLRLLLQKFMP